MFNFNVTSFDAKALKKTAVIFAQEKARLLAEGEALDKLCQGALKKALKNSRFAGEAGEALVVAGLSGAVESVVIVGLGKTKEIQENHWRLRGIEVGKRLDQMGTVEAFLVLGKQTGKVTPGTATAALLQGMHLALYRFDIFKTELKPHQKARFRRCTVAVEPRSVPSVKKDLAGFKGLMAGSDLTRELVNLPPNIALPQYMVTEAKKLAPLGIKVEVLDEKRLKKLGMNLMLGVGAGAAPDQQPRLIVMKYQGTKKKVPFKAIVGKGVMFDSGGYNLKPTGSMETMKCDMAGAAVVMGLMKALARRKSPVNVIGVCGCVINMLSDRAYLPSTILKSYQGVTVEIGNTDAEGRLVLADAMAYIIDKERPSELIDLATLTGACMVALGGQYAGLFSTSDRMAKALLKAGEQTGEKLWRLPVDDAYAAKPLLADVNNDGKRFGGASTAAVFLKKFVGKTPWAHLDIAGVALQEKVAETSIPVAGATGFGVRLLVDYLEK